MYGINTLDIGINYDIEIPNSIVRGYSGDIAGPSKNLKM